MENLTDIIDSAAAAHPEPSARADEFKAEAAADLASNGDAAPGPPGWNPEIHETPPRKTTRNTWAMLKGRTRAQADEQQQSPLEAAAAMADTLFAVAPAMLGEKWEPTPAERERITAALARYYEATGIIDLPPGVALTVALGTYVLPRAITPALRARIGLLVGADPTAADGDAGSRQGPSPAATMSDHGVPLDVRDAA